MISQSSVAVATGCWNWDRRAARTTERSTISEGWGAQPLYLLSRAGERGGAKPPAPRHARGCFPASAPSCLAAVFTQLALLGAAVPMAPPYRPSWPCRCSGWLPPPGCGFRAQCPLATSCMGNTKPSSSSSGTRNRAFTAPCFFPVPDCYGVFAFDPRAAASRDIFKFFSCPKLKDSSSMCNAQGMLGFGGWGEGSPGEGQPMCTVIFTIESMRLEKTSQFPKSNPNPPHSGAMLSAWGSWGKYKGGARCSSSQK